MRTIANEKQTPKWMLFSSELMLGKSASEVADEYNTTEKKIQDLLNHTLKDSAPSMWLRLRNNSDLWKNRISEEVNEDSLERIRNLR